MKRISYAGISLLTGDRIADVVLDYAAVLARAGVADRISVPTTDGHGAPTEIDVVMGPASQVIAQHEDYFGEELTNEAFVDDVLRRTRKAAAGRPVDIPPRDDIPED